MSKKNSQKRYEELKDYYKKEAKSIEKQLHMDLVAVRHEYVPHHLKSKFIAGCAIFGSVYLAEKLIFGKRVPRILRFTTSLTAIVWAPKLYQKLHDKVTGIGEQEPIEMEMLEDQQFAEDNFSAETELDYWEEDEKVIVEETTILPVTSPENMLELENDEEEQQDEIFKDKDDEDKLPST